MARQTTRKAPRDDQPAADGRGRGEVQSLVRGLSLIEALADFDGGSAALGDLAARTGLSPSTTHRLLATLQAEGYVIREHDSSRYALGHRIMGTAATVQQRTGPLRATVRPHLEAIAADTGETAYLVVLDETHSVYLDAADGRHALRMSIRVGSTFPAHTSASAKAILAHRSDDAAIERIFSQPALARLTPRTIMTARAFRAQLGSVRERGYAVEKEELEAGVACIAAPLIDRSGEAVAALSVPGPVSRVLTPTAERIGGVLRGHATELSAALGKV